MLPLFNPKHGDPPVPKSCAFSGFSSHQTGRQNSIVQGSAPLEGN